MKADSLFRGEMVRLVAENPDVIAQAFSRWSRNSEYKRLASTNPAILHSVKGTEKWIEAFYHKPSDKDFFFQIRTLADDRFIGDISLDGIQWSHGDSFVGIGIGSPADWGKGYGTDAMRTVLRYAFQELNLRRVSLNTFEYNPRGIRSYLKAGFKEEGRVRQYLNRDGRRWDLIYMGILREEWQTLYKEVES